MTAIVVERRTLKSIVEIGNIAISVLQPLKRPSDSLLQGRQRLNLISRRHEELDKVCACSGHVVP